MKRWSIIAIVLLVGAGIFAWSWFSEPRYGGKSVSGWLEVAASVDEGASPNRIAEASNALSHIDARGVPVLLNLMRANDSLLKIRLYELLNKQSLVTFRGRSAGEKHMLAAFGFSCLKTNADSACPQLAAWLFATNDPYNCAEALAGIGAAGVPAINAALTNSNSEIQMAAAYASLHLKSDVLMTNMFFVLTNGEPRTVAIAARWLKDKIPREDYFNVMTFLLHRPARETGAASFAFRELVRMTNEWPRVFPHVATLLTNSSFGLRGLQRAATNALIRIDPIRAAALGVNTNPPRPTARPPGGRRGRQ